MTEEEKKKESGEISRREFLKDAGLIVGGAAIGSTVLLAACGEEGEVTTETVTQTQTQTQTETVTTTQQVGEVTTTATETVEVSKFICPYDGQEFDTLSALEAHVEAEHPEGIIPGLITLTANGKTYVVQSEDSWSLLYVLREKLGLTGAKAACDTGDCGACTIIMDGRPVLACLVLAKTAQGKDIQTIEGLATGDELTPLQQAFVDKDAMECGFCTPAMIMSAKALLAFKAQPTPDEVREFLAGNICKCGKYHNIVDAVIVAGS